MDNKYDSKGIFIMAFKALKECPYCVVVTTEDEKGSDLLEQCRNEEQNKKKF